MSTTDQPREPGDTAGPAPHVAPRPRVFIGLTIAPEIARALAALAQDLERFDIRPVPAADIHITLVPPWTADSIADAIEKLRGAVRAGSVGPFALTFHHVGYAQQPRRPRFLWAECMADPALSQLHAALRQAYGNADDRPFRPHATLARLRARGPAIARRCPLDRPLALTQQVVSVALFQSPPAGQRGYRVLASVPLAAAGDRAAAPAATDACGEPER